MQPVLLLITGLFTVVGLLSSDSSFAQESRARRGGPPSTAQKEMERYMGGPRDQMSPLGQTEAISADADDCTDQNHCSNVVTSGTFSENRREIQRRVELYLRGEADKASQGGKAVQ